MEPKQVLLWYTHDLWKMHNTLLYKYISLTLYSSKGSKIMLCVRDKDRQRKTNTSGHPFDHTTTFAYFHWCVLGRELLIDGSVRSQYATLILLVRED